MKYALIPLALLLAGCGKTQLVSVPYMPAPPSSLMREPQELNTIKEEQPKEEEAPE